MLICKPIVSGFICFYVSRPINLEGYQSQWTPASPDPGVLSLAQGESVFLPIFYQIDSHVCPIISPRASTRLIASTRTSASFYALTNNTAQHTSASDPQDTSHSPQYSIPINSPGQSIQVESIVTYYPLKAPGSLQGHQAPHLPHHIETLP